MLLITNMKLHTSFRLVPKSTTLNGHYSLYFRMCVFGAHHKNLNENGLIVLAAKMKPMESTLVPGNIRITQITRIINRSTTKLLFAIEKVRSAKLVTQLTQSWRYYWLFLHFHLQFTQCPLSTVVSMPIIDFAFWFHSVDFALSQFRYSHTVVSVSVVYVKVAIQTGEPAVSLKQGNW